MSASLADQIHSAVMEATHGMKDYGPRVIIRGKYLDGIAFRRPFRQRHNGVSYWAVRFYGTPFLTNPIKTASGLWEFDITYTLPY